MAKSLSSNEKIIIFPQNKTGDAASRKTGLNQNREGSVRKINGKVYVDFMYLGERVRESSQLDWTAENIKHVREQLDKIVVSIKSGHFRFAEVFPASKKKDYFSEKERQLFGSGRTPGEVNFAEYAKQWYELLKSSGRVSKRTLWGYNSYIENYLVPYFEELTFSDLNKAAFDRFVLWAKNLRLRGQPIGNETINKIFVPLKMICKDAAISYGWQSNFNPFFGFKRLPEGNSYENIQPFTLDEQARIIKALPLHWKPYFMFAFSSGLRQGEQIALQPDDIDWSRNLLKVRRAFTRDDNGKVMMGETKNKYSRRIIKLTESMLKPLIEQIKIRDQFDCQYFFCSQTGDRVHASNLRRRVWKSALKDAGVPYREMKQTRHSFATNALSCGENPLWIAKVMGHRDTDMIIRVYGKYIEDAGSRTDGSKLDGQYNGLMGKLE